MKPILETARLFLREMEETDWTSLQMIHGDPVTMAAYEHAFSEDEIYQWLQKNQQRYKQDGIGLWAVILKDRNEMIGECGLTWQPVENRRVLEVGYLFNRNFWHHGYATEAAWACCDFAFTELGAEEVYSIIRDSNEASRKVALRNGMQKQGQWIKYYYGLQMPHDLFRITKEQWQKRNKLKKMVYKTVK